MSAASAGLDEAEFKQLNTLVGQYRAILAEIFGVDVVAYEHGPGRLSAAGGCVDHAHVHLLPLKRSLEMRSPPPVRWEHFEEPVRHEQLAAMSDFGYLWLMNSEGTWLCGGEQVRSQELRRIASALLGDADRWDWAVWPRAENVRATIEALRGVGVSRGAQTSTEEPSASSEVTSVRVKFS